MDRNKVLVRVKGLSETQAKKLRQQKCQDRGLNTGPPECQVRFSLLLSQLSYPGSLIQYFHSPSCTTARVDGTISPKCIIFTYFFLLHTSRHHDATPSDSPLSVSRTTRSRRSASFTCSSSKRLNDART